MSQFTMGAERGVLLLGVAAILLGANLEPVYGQEAAAPPAGGLEEVVVTARRTEEVSQTVPIAITAFSGAQLEAQHIDNAFDLQQFVPSMVTFDQGASQLSTQYSIRGQDSSGGAASPPASVVAYFDEVPLPTDRTLASNGVAPFFDLANVQILNGPQGTLFGRNAAAGALLFQSQMPTDKYEGYAAVAVGNYWDREFELVANAPLVDDTLLLRVDVDRHITDGFTYDITTHQYVDNVDKWTSRATLSFLPNDSFRNDLIWNYSDDWDNGANRIITDVNPAGADAKLYNGIKGVPSIEQDFAQQQALGIRTETDAPPEGSALRYWGITNISTWNIASSLSLKNILADQELAGWSQFADTGIPTQTAQSGDSNRDLSEELKLTGSTKYLTWTAGGFTDKQTPVEPFYQDILSNTGLPTSPTPRDTTSITVRKSYALYSQETYNLGGLSQVLDGLRVTAGYRYTWDERSDVIDVTGAHGVCSTCNVSVDTPSSDGTWTVGLDYQIDPVTLVYAKVSHGYKTGGVNPTPVSTYAPQYDLEDEVGLKKDWNFGAVQFRSNIDVYYDDTTNVQQTAQSEFEGTPTRLLLSVGDAVYKGVEFTGTLVAFRNFQLSATYSYLDAYYTRVFSNAMGFSIDTPFPESPKNEFSATGSYTISLGEYGKLVPTASYSYIASRYTLTVDTPGTRYDPVGLLQGGVTWSDIANKPLDLTFYMTNALNRDYKEYILSQYSTSGYDMAIYGPPREYTLQLKYKW